MQRCDVAQRRSKLWTSSLAGGATIFRSTERVVFRADEVIVSRNRQPADASLVLVSCSASKLQSALPAHLQPTARSEASRLCLPQIVPSSTESVALRGAAYKQYRAKSTPPRCANLLVVTHGSTSGLEIQQLAAARHCAASDVGRGRGSGAPPIGDRHNNDHDARHQRPRHHLDLRKRPLTATRDEALRFCSDVTEKALASLEPETSLYVQDVAQALKEVWNCTLLLVKALYAFLKLVGEPLLRKLAQSIARQPTNIKAAEVALLLTIFVLWRVEAYPRGRKMLKRWHRAFVIRRVSFDAKRNKIKRAYRRALEGMSSKSRACMSVAPHFTFFAVILLVRHVNPTLSTGFWTSPYIVFVCASLRLVNADAALKKAAALDKVEDIVSANRRRYSEDPRGVGASCCY